MEHLSSYLQLSEAERVGDIRIGGEKVVEVDISSAHLTILHGLFGLQRPQGDLYAAVPGVPRTVAKAWTTAALGSGYARTTWPRIAEPRLLQYDPQMIRDAMVAAYPFLLDLAVAVPAELRAAHSNERTLTALYLQAVEAGALTAAMRRLREGGRLALPTHDGMIVPASVEATACSALRAAIEAAAGVIPVLDVTR
ncbi:hypothetical protein IBL26_08260 [Roseomonas aerophila]|uniref:Uncharacterized protein n=1 Tax=Teichococcus aerophilus TaxID=1224513 RepID=A0ABR7RL03_9PROT|nr:hypothetical protein [Pseudoroseomonas aerophila]MBC9206827.1 hypothetical protein [Pseudoroseomonas aerophila]